VPPEADRDCGGAPMGVAGEGESYAGMATVAAAEDCAWGNGAKGAAGVITGRATPQEPQNAACGRKRSPQLVQWAANP